MGMCHVKLPYLDIIIKSRREETAIIDLAMAQRSPDMSADSRNQEEKYNESLETYFEKSVNAVRQYVAKYAAPSRSSPKCTLLKVVISA